MYTLLARVCREQNERVWEQNSWNCCHQELASLGADWLGGRCSFQRRREGTDPDVTFSLQSGSGEQVEWSSLDLVGNVLMKQNTIGKCKFVEPEKCFVSNVAD